MKTRERLNPNHHLICLGPVRASISQYLALPSQATTAGIYAIVNCSREALILSLCSMLMKLEIFNHHTSKVYTCMYDLSDLVPSRDIGVRKPIVSFA